MDDCGGRDCDVSLRFTKTEGTCIVEFREVGCEVWSEGLT